LRTDLVFNELSLLPPYGSNLAAQEAMDTFIATIKACRQVGIGAILRLPEGFHYCELAVNYPIARWLNDGDVNKEKKLFIGTLATKIPYFEDLLGTAEANGFDEAEFVFDGNPANGLGVAYILDAVGISLSQSPPWNGALVRIIYRTLNNVTGEIDDNEEDVRHVSSPDQAAWHGLELRNVENAAVASGASLWAACPRLFPALKFCGAVELQIKGLTWGSGGLSVVFRSLKELQTLCENWIEGPFDSRGIPNTTREGGATLQQFGEERTFTKPDGVAEVFSWHMKRGTLRIHFVPDGVTRTCIVGYVGPHLRTVRNQ
jgi:hypothetical protein